MRLLIAAVLLLCIPPTVSGQTTPAKSTVQQSHLWLQGFSTIRLDKHWSVPVEVQVRRAETGLTWQGLLVRGALMRDINDHVAVGGGYGHQISWRYGPFAPVVKFGEHRTYEQVIIKNNFGTTGFEQRVRLEQRWIQRVDSTRRVALDEHFYQNRLRYRAGISVPLRFAESAKGKSREAETFFYLNDEVMVSFGKDVDRNEFDQNRFAIGIGQKLGEVVMQAGYLHQYLKRANGFQFESNHTIVLSFSYNFSLP